MSDNSPIDFECKRFEDLTLHELYAILKVRFEVFVTEQECFDLDPDDRDQDAWHLIGRGKPGGPIACYARLFPASDSDRHAHIGRVLVVKDFRRKRLGTALMKEAILMTRELSAGVKDATIDISAQDYVRRFYEDLGFSVTGPGYLEGGIPHVPMTLVL